MSDYDLSSLARLDLRKIWMFTAEKWGRRKADSYLQEIRATIGIVASDYHIGVQIDPLDPDLRRAFIGSHAVFYRITGKQIRVIRVLHQAMDSGSHLN